MGYEGIVDKAIEKFASKTFSTEEYKEELLNMVMTAVEHANRFSIMAFYKTGRKRDRERKAKENKEIEKIMSLLGDYIYKQNVYFLEIEQKYKYHHKYVK